MRFDLRAVPYWAVFGLGLGGGAALFVVDFLRLQEAYVARELTRAVLVDTLIPILGALALFLAAGWGFANRPRPQRRLQVDGFTYR